MTRSELYKKVILLGLQDSIKKKFDMNFTNLSNEVLEAEITANQNTGNEEKEEEYVSKKTIIKLLSTLQTNNFISESDVDYIME